MPHRKGDGCFKWLPTVSLVWPAKEVYKEIHTYSTGWQQFSFGIDVLDTPIYTACTLKYFPWGQRIINKKFREIPNIQKHWKPPTLLWDGAQTTLLVGLSASPEPCYRFPEAPGVRHSPCPVWCSGGEAHTDIAARGSDTLLSQPFCCWHLSPLQNLLQPPHLRLNLQIRFN